MAILVEKSRQSKARLQEDLVNTRRTPADKLAPSDEFKKKKEKRRGKKNSLVW